MSQRSCPVCLNISFDPIFDAVIDDFDGTTLDKRILVVCCKRCGFVFNILDVTSSYIENHYQNEALYQTETGFGVGGTTPADVVRYARYYTLLEPFFSSKDKIVIDIGCSKGGFLASLRMKGFNNLIGIELDPICAEYARKNHSLHILNGSANTIPLPDKEADILVYSHVLEHLEDLDQVPQEMHRVLKDGGIVFIEVPDALYYSDAKMFDFFHWFGMREHINHFDKEHLSMLMTNAGFETIKISEVIENLSPLSMTLKRRPAFPMLSGIFRKSNKKATIINSTHQQLREALNLYISAEQELLERSKKQILQLEKSGRPIFVWGIALEFFCVYSFGGLKKCNIIALVDKSPFKQTKTVNSLPTISPEALQSVPPDAVVVITSTFHADTMQDYLKKINFKGDIVVFR